jgi:hypothetical protein
MDQEADRIWIRKRTGSGQEADRIWIRKRIGYGSGSGQEADRTFAWIGYG